MKKSTLITSVAALLLIIISLASTFPAETPPTVTPQKPKLVIGIVIDQMRYDFLFRYWDKYVKAD
jgi:predicted AlkP superfamily pyrophosphatase or phosphodiesterase